MVNQSTRLVAFLAITAPFAACTSSKIPAGIGVIEANPSIIDTCTGDGLIVSEIRWRVTDPFVDKVRIEVSQVGDSDRKVFYGGAPEGAMHTEKWVRPGTVFILLDDSSNRVIDTIEVRGRSC